MQLEIKSTRLILSCLLGKICWLVVEQAIPQYSVEPLSRGKKNKKTHLWWEKVENRPSIPSRFIPVVDLLKVDGKCRKFNGITLDLLFWILGKRTYSLRSWISWWIWKMTPSQLQVATVVAQGAQHDQRGGQPGRVSAGCPRWYTQEYHQNRHKWVS